MDVAKNCLGNKSADASENASLHSLRSSVSSEMGKWESTAMHTSGVLSSTRNEIIEIARVSFRALSRSVNYERTAASATDEPNSLSR